MVPQIDPLWVIAMIVTGGIGVIVHILILIKTVPHLFSSKLNRKGKIFIFGCILVFILNGIACLFWLLFRTNILINNLSISSCKFIYTTNFVCYFVAKYILHCLLIGRIHLTFYGTPYHIERKYFLIFIAFLSIHCFVTISVWIYQVTPHILEGSWMKYSICTLFNDHVNQTVSVKLCAVLIGVEDFVVGSFTLCILLKRLNKVATGTGDYDLIAKSARYGVVASIAMISTFFLFTLAVPFYKNVTFIISVDATINSLCIFCVLSIGYKTYYYLFCPFLFCPSKYIGNEEKMKRSSISTIIHKRLPPTKTQKQLALYLETNSDNINNGNINNDNNNIFKDNNMYNVNDNNNNMYNDNNGAPKMELKIMNIASEPARIIYQTQNQKRLEAQYNSVSNPLS